MLKIGDTIPDVDITVVSQEGNQTLSAQKYCAGKTIVLFAVPGAFTPTCSDYHLPGYITLADQIKAKGVDEIACISVNDAFVMKAWGASQHAEEITLIADGGAEFTQALGLTMNTASFGGTRSQRYAMVIKDSVVTLLNVEPPKTFELSKAETILASL